MLAFLALIAQAAAVWTGIEALQRASCRSCWQAVAVTSVVSCVGVVVACIMLVDSAPPRLQYGLDHLMPVFEGAGLALLHRAFIRERRA